MSRTDSPDPEGIARAGEYVLGVLSAEERAAFVADIKTEPDLAAALIYWEQRLAALAEGVASIEPPRRLFADIETRIDEIETARPPFIARAGFWQIVAGFAMAALVFVLTNPFLTAPDGPRFAATLGSADAGIEVLAGFDSADGQLRFTRISGAQPPDRDLQVWVIVGDGVPVPVGLLSRNERGALTISDELRAAVPGATLAISEEPLGGSPTGLPTGPILASGTLTRL